LLTKLVIFLMILMLLLPLYDFLNFVKGTLFPYALLLIFLLSIAKILFIVLVDLSLSFNLAICTSTHNALP